MTINYSNQYEVGFFLPPSGSTTTTSTCYSLSCSPTSTTSTTNVYSSKTSTLLTRDMLLSCNLQQAEYNGIYSSPVVQSRARCRTLPAQPSVTCPGERGNSSAAAAVGAVSIGTSQHQHIQQPTQSIRLELDQSSLNIQKMDTWTESFQDLRSFCSPDQDELNTPQITLQDEFNFNPDGQVNNLWGFVHSPVEINDQAINQDLLASPNVMMDEENNNYTFIDIQGNFTSFKGSELGKSSVGKVMDLYNSPIVMMPGSSALKTKGHDVLLSQAIQHDDNSPVMAPGDMIVGGSFFDTKLNSSQMSATARLGSGGKLIFKQEQKECEELHSPGKETLPAVALPHHTIPVLQQQVYQSEQKRMPLAKTKPRPKLKPLNIPQPATNPNTLTTPDVLKPLTDISTNGFNLLQYVCGGGEDSRSQFMSGKESSVPLQDHDYTNSIGDENVIIKSEPVSPTPGLKFKAEVVSDRKRSPSTIPDDDFYDSDHEGESLADGDSGSDDWIPGGGKRSTTGRGTRRFRKLSTGGESFEGSDRYRTLRDRNNEASRRSRQNRKQRDMEIRRHKSELEKKNNVLRIKADRMEALVLEMRKALLQSIKNSRSSS